MHCIRPGKRIKMTFNPIMHTTNILECSSFRAYYFLHRGHPVIVILQAGVDNGCHILNTSHVTAVETRHPSGARVMSPHPSPAPWDTPALCPAASVGVAQTGSGGRPLSQCVPLQRGRRLTGLRATGWQVSAPLPPRLPRARPHLTLAATPGRPLSLGKPALGLNL